MNQLTKAIVLIFAVIGVVALVAVVSMWIMHGTMMNGMMGDGDVMGGGGWVLGVLLILLIITACAFVLAQLSARQ